MLEALKKAYKMYNGEVTLNINFKYEGAEMSYSFKGIGKDLKKSFLTETWTYIYINGLQTDYQISNLKRVRSLKYGKINILFEPKYRHTEFNCKARTYALFIKGKRYTFNSEKEYEKYFKNGIIIK